MGFKPDKTKFKDVGGRMITQGLFLEIGYTDNAYYTLDDEDKTYEGRVYPSLKRLYLEHEDVGEYDFAKTYLLNWRHWQRLCANKVLAKHIEEWREELEVKLRSDAIYTIIQLSSEEKGGFQAAKWIADRGWDVRSVGRPKKDTSEMDKKLEERLHDEYSADIVRLKVK